MVFFTCNHCGESVKKPSVEKHYQGKCRGAGGKSVSCMDCLKDFQGEEYVAHTKCITEVEKYSGKDYVHKESKNSNAKKQESWMDIIREILMNDDYHLKPNVRSAFERLKSVDNVPRKKAKFQNFVANGMHMPRQLAEEVWGVLEQELEKMKKAKQQAVAAVKETKELNGTTTSNTNGHVKSEESKETPTQPENPKEKESKKRNLEQKENGHSEGVAVEPTKKKPKKQGVKEVAGKPEKDVATAPEIEFQWHVVLEKVVRKYEDGMPVEKLKSKVLKKYIAKHGYVEIEEQQRRKFEKKFKKYIKRCQAIQVVDDLVKPRIA